MHEAQFKHVDRVLFRPVVDLLPIYTLMGGGICEWQAAGLLPNEGDEADVAVAHRGFAEEVNTVL